MAPVATTHLVAVASPFRVAGRPTRVARTTAARRLRLRVMGAAIAALTADRFARVARRGRRTGAVPRPRARFGPECLALMFLLTLCLPPCSRPVQASLRSSVLDALRAATASLVVKPATSAAASQVAVAKQTALRKAGSKVEQLRIEVAACHEKLLRLRAELARAVDAAQLATKVFDETLGQGAQGKLVTSG